MCTPLWLFKRLDNEFHFTLDAASSDQNCLVEKHYTLETNGLAQSWKGERVWVNPPYNRGQARTWILKSLAELNNGAEVIVILLQNKTQHLWFGLLWDYSKSRPRKHIQIRFLPRSFQWMRDPPTEQWKTRAKFGSMVVVMSKKGFGWKDQTINTH